MKPRVIFEAPLSKHTARVHVSLQLREMDNAGHGQTTLFAPINAYVEFPAGRRSLYIKLVRAR